MCFPNRCVLLTQLKLSTVVAQCLIVTVRVHVTHNNVGCLEYQAAFVGVGECVRAFSYTLHVCIVCVFVGQQDYQLQSPSCTTSIMHVQYMTLNSRHEICIAMEPVFVGG